MREAELFRIEGRVQGVGYRWWATQTARRLGVCGWVRNRRDGSVELLAIAAADARDALAAACAGGPSAAQVVQVARHPAADDGSESFHERPTE
jgi:acylphosphatase